MLQRNLKRLMTAMLAFTLMLTFGTMIGYAADWALGVNGLTATYEGGTLDDKKLSVTGTAASGSGCNQTAAESASATIILQNTSGSAATLTFDYNVITANSNGYVKFENSDSGLSGSGTHSCALENNESITLNLSSGDAGAYTTSIEFSNITLTVASTKTATFHVSSAGAYTIDDVTGTTASATVSTESVSFAFDDTKGITITAPAGYHCVGLQYTDGILFPNASGVYIPSDGQVFTPIFAAEDTDALFTVNGTSYYTWASAMAASKSTGQPAILAVTNYSLPTAADALTPCSNEYVTFHESGQATYIIPSGCRLLLPYSASDTGIWGAWSGEKNDLSSTPTTFRSLTVPSGVTIECSGQINVNGQRYISSKQGAESPGRPAGGHGLLLLSGSGDQLVLNPGAKLYCYGFIAGNGRVNAKSGSEVREIMQISDFGGGANTMGWYGLTGNKSTSKLFLIAHYYIQNIEAPFHIEYGANLYGEAALYIEGVYASSAGIIGTSNAMFLLSSGNYIDRTYNAETDQVTYKLGGSGTASIGSVSVTVKSTFTELDLNSSDYMLPINCALKIQVSDGTTVNVDKNIAMMPDAELLIDKGGTVNLSSSVFLFEKGDWLYGSSAATNVLSFGSNQSRSPRWTYGRKASQKLLAAQKDAHITINGTLNVNSGGVFVTDAAGANIHLTGTGKIANNVSTASASVKGGFDGTVHTLTSPLAVANLAGVGTMKTIGQTTYYGQDNSYWYEYAIYESTAGSVSVNDELGTKASTLSSADGRSKENVVAVSAANGTVKFSADPSCYCTANSTAQLKPSTPGSNSYTLSPVTADTTLTPVAHTEGEAQKVISTSATCTETGWYDSVVYCTNDGCGIELSRQEKAEEIPALGHDYAPEVTAPTCTEQGYTTHTCQREDCGDSYKDTYVSALGHAWNEDEWSYDSDGHWHVCTNVGCTERRDAAAHSGGNKTCYKQAECYHCGQPYGDTLPHSYTVASDSLVSEATCTEPAMYWAKCSDCGTVSDTEKIPVGEALGHKYESSSVKFSDDKTTYTVTVTCSQCTVDTENHELTSDALPSVVSGAANNCQTTGTLTYTAKGAFEGVPYEATATEENVAGPHSLVKTEAKAATCSEAGNYAYWTCQVENCGKVFADENAETETTVEAQTIPIDENAHSWEEKSSTASCIQAGTTHYTCAYNSEHTKTEATEALGHSWTTTETAASCTTPAYTETKCSRCGYSYITVTGDPPGHSFADGVCGSCGTLGGGYIFSVSHNLNLLDLVQIGYWVQMTEADSPQPAEAAETAEATEAAEASETTEAAEDAETTDTTEAADAAGISEAVEAADNAGIARAVDLTNATYGIDVWAEGKKQELTLSKRGGYYQAYAGGVLAQLLNTPHYACPYIEVDGQKYYSDKVDKFAVTDYAAMLFKNGYTAGNPTHDVVRDLVNYATNAQNYFRTRNGVAIEKETPINASLKTEYRDSRYTAEMKVTGGKVNGTEWYGSTINLDEAIALNFYANTADFTHIAYIKAAAYDESIENVTQDSDGAQTLMLDTSGSRPLAKFTNIYPKDMGIWYYGCMYNEEGSYSSIRVDSVNAYLTRGIAASEVPDSVMEPYMADTFKDMLAYGDSARKYADSVNSSTIAEGE